MKDIAKIVIALLLIVARVEDRQGACSACSSTLAAVGPAGLGRNEAARQRQEADRLMEIMAVILAIVIGFIVLKFISGMVKFAVLAVILLALFYFMTGGFGA